MTSERSSLIEVLDGRCDLGTLAGVVAVPSVRHLPLEHQDRFAQTVLLNVGSKGIEFVPLQQREHPRNLMEH
jgi:hypothetical protein